MKPFTWTHAPRGDGRSSRRTIGVLVDNLIDGYQRMLFGSIARTALEHDANVIGFVGGTLPSSFYELVSTQTVDALIITSATLWRGVGQAGLTAFCRHFGEVPVCSVGVQVEGTSSIVTNDSPGAGALVTHLLADHRKKSIACIRGPGADGQERFDAYRRTLEEFGVEFREELVVPGDFTQRGGAEAVRILCDERKVEFDAIVAASDYMALGAIEALEARDLSVPGDVAVVGFDDIEDARHAPVPLTTVRQPIRELGKRAVLQVLQQVNEGDSAATQSITCHPLKRRSCGCVVESPFTRRPASASHRFTDPEAALLARRDLVLADMSRTAQGELGNVGYEWEVTLYDAVLEQLRGAPHNPFLIANEKLSRRVFRGGGDVSTWQRVLATLRHHVLECVGDDLKLRSTAENAFYDAVILSGSVVGREEAQRRDALGKLLGAAVKTGNTLMTSFGPDQLGGVLVDHLQSLGIPSCYLSLFEGDHTRARLAVGFDRKLPATRTDTELTFSSAQLAPPGLLPTDRPTVYAVLPLSHQGHELGFALFEYGEDDGVRFEVLREQFAAAFEAAGQR